MRYNPPPQGNTLIPMLSHLANPARFMRISGVALPWLGGVSLVVLVLGLFWSLILAPPDYQQGESVRIMFVHVPSAWMALSTYLFIAVASAVALVWRHPLADVAAQWGGGPSLRRCRGAGGGPDRRGLHAGVPRHRVAVGPADVGRVVGVGRAAD